jgi:hypothetical protein
MRACPSPAQAPKHPPQKIEWGAEPALQNTSDSGVEKVIRALRSEKTAKDEKTDRFHLTAPRGGEADRRGQGEQPERLGVRI